MSIWTQPRFQGPRPRHALGLWLNYAKLASKAYLPTRRDRLAMVGCMPFDVVLGGQQDEISLGANQTIELRFSVQSDFIAHSIMVSASSSSQASPGCRIALRDFSIMPGKGKNLSNAKVVALVNNVNFGGSGSKPRFLRKPYCFKAGRIIVATITNMRGAANKIQVVISGVFDE